MGGLLEDYLMTKRIKSNRVKQIVPVAVLLFSFTGCVPKMHTTSPAVEGKVLDSVTHEPLKAVQVGGAITDRDGRFFLEGEKELGIGTPMGGVWRLPAVMMKVSKKGYHPVYCTCESFSTQEGCTDVVIEMIPLSQKAENVQWRKEETGFSCRPIIKEK